MYTRRCGIYKVANFRHARWRTRLYVCRAMDVCARARAYSHVRDQGRQNEQPVPSSPAERK